MGKLQQIFRCISFIAAAVMPAVLFAMAITGGGLRHDTIQLFCMYYRVRKNWEDKDSQIPEIRSR